MDIDQAKALFFAQYYGQQLYTKESYNGEGGLRSVCTYHFGESEFSKDMLTDGYLLLRSVNQLTDEEKKFIAQFSYYSSSLNLKQVDQLFEQYMDKQTVVTGNNWWVIKDYLIRVGIILPFTYLNEENKAMILSPDEIVAKGWAKIKTD